MISLDKFINIKDTRRDKDGNQKERYLENMQDVEEWALYFNDDWPQFDTPKPEDPEYQKAKTYFQSQVAQELKAQSKYSIDDWRAEILSAIRGAYGRAWQISYEDEWLAKFYRLLVKQIDETIKEWQLKSKKIWLYETDNPKSKHMLLPADKHDLKEGWEYNFIAFEATRKEVEALNDGYYDLKQFRATEDLFGELLLGGSLDLHTMHRKLEYIDYHGTLGNTDDWYDMLTEHDDLVADIKATLQTEKARHDDKKYLQEQITVALAQINQLLAEYSTDKEYNNQIKRAIGSIEATTKKAITQ